MTSRILQVVSNAAQFERTVEPTGQSQLPGTAFGSIQTPPTCDVAHVR